MWVLYLCGGWPEEAGGKDNGQVVGSHFVNVFMLCYPEGKKKGGWDREREEGREGGRKGGREEGREGEYQQFVSVLLSVYESFYIPP